MSAENVKKVQKTLEKLKGGAPQFIVKGKKGFDGCGLDLPTTLSPQWKGTLGLCGL